MTRQVFCLLVTITLLYHEQAFATFGTCEKPGSNEVATCFVNSDRCNVTIINWNTTTEPMCSAISEYRPLPDGNEINYEITVIAYDKSFKENAAYRASGVNVSLAVRHKDTTGFVVWFSIKAVEEYHLCRYIDVPTNTNTTSLLQISYDCMFFKPEEANNPFTLMVTELPSRLQRELSCRVPDSVDLNPDNVAKWKSMICVELFSSEMASVYMWFQTAPHKFGHLNYSVVLFENDTAVESRIVYTVKQFHLEKFSNLPPGRYIVKMKPLHPDCGSTCLTTMSWPFFISGKEGDSNSFLPTHAIIAIVVVIPFILFIAWVISSRVKPSVKGLTLYLVYVYHQKSHFQVVNQFATLLQSHNFKVLFDHFDMQDPNPMDWIKDCVNDADFILIVWSEAAIRRYLGTETEADKQDEPNYLTSHLFNFILNRIDCRVNDSCNRKNKHSPDSVSNICWDTSTKQNIPDRCNSYRTFLIPNKFPRLLRYLFNYATPRNLPCEAFLPKVPGENLNDYKEGCMFLEALSRYQQELVHGPEFDGHGSVFEEVDNLSQHPLVNGVQNPLNDVDLLPNESLADQGYESLSTENTNASIQTVNPSMSFSVSEPVDVQATNTDVAPPYSDEKETERGLEFLRSILS